jgi:aromatic ring-opening dioxygenase catalytic subunit (LigB family)
MIGNTSTQQGSVIFIPHGGGPMPLLGDSSHEELVHFLKNVKDLIHKPKAILMISAHWEEDIVSITSNEAPELIYDYYGFPEQAYQIKYPARGNPTLARKVFNLLQSKDIAAKLDSNRGFDHGMYVPLKLMYPKADIPCIQLSLVNTLDAQSHINIGKALKELLNDNILIVGSGFSFHNMKEFRSSNDNDHKNEAFEKWLIDTCTNKETNFSQKEQALINWEKAPFARYCQPREEHLLPLHICLGAGSASAKLVFDRKVIGKKSSAFLWKKTSNKEA